MSGVLATDLRLPCGAALPNRLAKAAMTEGVADRWLRATPRHAQLYRTWSEGGAGMLLTGNVQVDRADLERPGNVAIDRSEPRTYSPEARAALAAFDPMAKHSACHDRARAQPNRATPIEARLLVRATPSANWAAGAPRS